MILKNRALVRGRCLLAAIALSAGLLGAGLGAAPAASAHTFYPPNPCIKA